MRCYRVQVFPETAGADGGHPFHRVHPGVRSGQLHRRSRQYAGLPQGSARGPGSGPGRTGAQQAHSGAVCDLCYQCAQGRFRQVLHLQGGCTLPDCPAGTRYAGAGFRIGGAGPRDLHPAGRICGGLSKTEIQYAGDGRVHSGHFPALLLHRHHADLHLLPAPALVPLLRTGGQRRPSWE